MSMCQTCPHVHCATDNSRDECLESTSVPAVTHGQAVTRGLGGVKTARTAMNIYILGCSGHSVALEACIHRNPTKKNYVACVGSSEETVEPYLLPVMMI